MSRVGKKTIILPPNVSFTSANGVLTVKGPKGELTKPFDTKMVSIISDSDTEFHVEPLRNTKDARALWGTYAALVRAMVKGVSEGYVRKLEIIGVGYRAEVKGKSIVLNLGYSHPIEMEIPQGIDVVVEKNIITLSSHDKEALGQFAANIRKHREPEPYKGKGIKYEEETIRRKEGKKSA